MVTFLPGELSAIDIINIASFNKNIRTAKNAFGRDAYQSRYGGKAVPWKMIRMAVVRKGEETEAEHLKRQKEYLERLAVINPSVSKGLSNAIDITKKHTEKGVASVVYSDGTTGVMPLKAAIMGYEGKNGTVSEYKAYSSARAAASVVRASVPVMA